MNKKRKGKSPLKQYRERLTPRPTQQDVASAIPMSLRAYQEVETGDSIPELPNALRICEILQISFSDFCRMKGLDVSGIPSETPDPIQEDA
jgi:DNA-binding XRE family transcriptional regulator